MADGDVQPEVIFEGLGQGPEEAAALMDRAFVGMLNVLVGRTMELWDQLELDDSAASHVLEEFIESASTGQHIGEDIIAKLKQAEERRDGQ